jgi:ABC-type Fe3+-hydroxamate transport system substrate-binding protein
LYYNIYDFSKWGENMKKSKMLALLLASCFIMASCGTGGTGIEENENGSFTIEVTDQIGRIVNIKAPAKRVVSSSYTSTSLLLALGAGDRIVGIEAGAPEKKLYSLTAPWLMDLPAVSTEKEMDIDAARALEPDLVVIPKRFSDSVVAFEELGIHVVVANPETADDFIKCITMLGKLTGRGKRAEELIEYYRSKTHRSHGLCPRPARGASNPGNANPNLGA